MFAALNNIFIHDPGDILGIESSCMGDLYVAKLGKSANQNCNSVQLLDLIPIFTYLRYGKRIIIKS